MHIYIYDNNANDRKNENTIARIETRITDLGLSGKIIRLGVMSSLHESIANELKRGAKTIIVVGDIKILNQTVNVLAEIISKQPVFNNIPLGFIPLGKEKNVFINNLSLGYEEEACNTISARLIKQFSLGRANRNYFIFNASIPTEHTTLEIDEKYSVEIIKDGLIEIINSSFAKINKKTANINSNNHLELIINTSKENRFKLSKHSKNSSIFLFNNLRVINNKHELLLDQAVSVPPPIDIDVASEKINLIVGKDKI